MVSLPQVEVKFLLSPPVFDGLGGAQRRFACWAAIGEHKIPRSEAQSTNYFFKLCRRGFFKTVQFYNYKFEIPTD